MPNPDPTINRPTVLTFKINDDQWRIVCGRRMDSPTEFPPAVSLRRAMSAVEIPNLSIECLRKNALGEPIWVPLRDQFDMPPGIPEGIFLGIMADVIAKIAEGRPFIECRDVTVPEVELTAGLGIRPGCSSMT